MFTVSVPATSANLGVGYDVMGLALELYLNVTFSAYPQGVSIQGGDPRFQNADNLIYQAFVKGCEAMGEPVPGVQLRVDAQIPDARGLGSSAACIVAGLVGANQWFDSPLDAEALLTVATAMEGHPDNVAPALFGQLTVTIMADQKPVCVHYQLDQRWRFGVVIPDTPLPTAQARAVLPKTMSYADASYQMGHCTLACTALARGDQDLLKVAAVDRMQEPYRAQLIPDFTGLRQAAAAKDVQLLISGAGSTMLAITQNQSGLHQFLRQAKAAHPQWQVQAVAINQAGAGVTPAQALAE